MSESLSIINDAILPSSDRRPELGAEGERVAAEYLVSAGYRLVMANFRVPVGRNRRGVQVTGEIDIIAMDGDTICFVEVKTRRSEAFAPAAANVYLKKQRQIIRTSKIYRRTFGVWDVPHRFDVVTVIMPPNSPHKIDVIKGFWNEAKFKKRSWHREAWMDVRSSYGEP